MAQAHAKTLNIDKGICESMREKESTWCLYWSMKMSTLPLSDKMMLSFTFNCLFEYSCIQRPEKDVIFSGAVVTDPSYVDAGNQTRFFQKCS